jgi:hypothetical protein
VKKSALNAIALVPVTRPSLGGAQQNRWGYRKAERLGGLEINDDLLLVKDSNVRTIEVRGGISRLTQLEDNRPARC